MKVNEGESFYWLIHDKRKIFYKARRQIVQHGDKEIGADPNTPEIYINFLAPNHTTFYKSRTVIRS